MRNCSIKKLKFSTKNEPSEHCFFAYYHHFFNRFFFVIFLIKSPFFFNFAEEEEDTTAWANHDRDYTYDELLQRVYDIIKDKNPDSVMGEKKKFVMRPPQVVKVGTKKSAFVNFTEIAKMLHRQPKHLLAFLFAELGTTGNLFINWWILNFRPNFFNSIWI